MLLRHDGAFLHTGHQRDHALDLGRRDVLTADLRKAIKDGVPLSEAVKTAARSEKTKWALFEEYNERNATTAYAELEWE